MLQNYRQMKFQGKILLFLLLVSASALSYGQIRIGPIAGLNMSKLSGDAPKDAYYGRFPGINVGAAIDVKLSKEIWFGLQPSFSQQGTKIRYDVRGIDELVDSLKLRLNYFSFPLLIKVVTANQKFYALSGIEFAMLLNSGLYSRDSAMELNGNISSWNLAVHFGAGMLIPVGKPVLFVELRYVQGVFNITDDQVGNTVIPRVKSNGLQILTGIRFPLKR